MRSFLYIINPVAGTRTKKNLREYIEKRTAAAGIPFGIIPSVIGGDYSFLHPLIKEKNITDVIIAGGDGTVNQVVGSLMNHDLNFGIIPAGSGNGLAFTAKIPKQPARALDIIFEGRALPTDGFMINEHFACMLCGLGFDAKVAHDFAQQPRRGLATYVKQVVKNFFRAKTYPFEIRIKEKTIPAEAYFISIANSNQFGNHFTIAPKASLSDGLLDIVIVSKQGKLSLLLQILKQVRGKNKPLPEMMVEGNKGVIYFQTASLTIKNLSGAPLHIDGDPAETADELNIRIQKNCFRLLQP